MHGFIYEWTNTSNGLKYIGRHQGTPDDGYVGSGTVFKNSYNKHPELFVRKILWESSNTTSTEIIQKEEEYLNSVTDDELYYGTNRKYYNQVRNSSGYTVDDNPMKHQEIIDKMMSTQKKNGTHKNPWERVVLLYGRETACAMNADKMIRNKNGSGNKGKEKTQKHKDNLSASITKMYEDKKQLGAGCGQTGRPRKTDYNEIVKLVKDNGMKNAANILSLSLAAMSGRYYNAVKALKK
jgi:hypothetical protein